MKSFQMELSLFIESYEYIDLKKDLMEKYLNVLMNYI